MKKMTLFIFTILWTIEINCQNINKMSDEYGNIYIPINDSTIMYCSKNGKKYEVKLNQISFIDGRTALVDFLKREYYELEPGDNDYAYRVFFFMLFDSKLKIKEVRGCIPPMIQYTETQKKRVKQYITGLQRTRNRWERKSKQKWYVYSFSFVTD